MFINWKQREISLNIVYYGPALSGKTTNLEQIHARTNPTVRSELFTLNTHEDRTIFFDFLQLEMGHVGGLRPRFGLYTVPGQVYYQATRQTVLRRADGLVFVADSHAARRDETRATWQEMQRCPDETGPRLPAVPGPVLRHTHGQGWPDRSLHCDRPSGPLSLFHFDAA